jgi:hypothetical protein
MQITKKECALRGKKNVTYTNPSSSSKMMKKTTDTPRTPLTNTFSTLEWSTPMLIMNTIK